MKTVCAVSKKHIISEELGYYSNKADSVAIIYFEQYFDQSYDYSWQDVGIWRNLRLALSYAFWWKEHKALNFI